MSVRTLIRLSAIALLLGVSSLCLAANALIVHDGTPGIEADCLAALTAKLVAAGFTVTPSVGVPGMLAGYEQIWDIRFNNTTPLTASDMTAYLGYLSGGGRLCLIGENQGFVTRNNSIVSFVSAAGGGFIAMTTPANTETVVPPFNGPTPDPTLTYLAAAGSFTSGNGTFVTVDTSHVGAALAFSPGTLTNAPSGALILVFDINWLQAGADAANQALTNNIIFYLSAPFAILGTGPPLPIPTLSTLALLLLGVALAAVAVRFLAGGVRAS